MSHENATAKRNTTSRRWSPGIFLQKKRSPRTFAGARIPGLSMLVRHGQGSDAVDSLTHRNLPTVREIDFRGTESTRKCLNPSEGGENDSFAKPLYGRTPVPRVRIPPSPPDLLVPNQSVRAHASVVSPGRTLGDRLLNSPCRTHIALKLLLP